MEIFGSLLAPNYSPTFKICVISVTPQDGTYDIRNWYGGLGEDASARKNEFTIAFHSSLNTHVEQNQTLSWICEGIVRAAKEAQSKSANNSELYIFSPLGSHWAANHSRRTASMDLALIDGHTVQITEGATCYGVTTNRENSIEFDGLG
ncbi:hypothetical protein TREMEDRAFT_65469 [Tremella mesenterica DSM 1558]|uniref:uncharacterized protein n=1 Tax=Tremella mesenterica (strain ATCC 24925 / CBS 8224 / DSM 1558 / NBRC 9311 / NRRL Y-6157 / RJB 2259-6 / UBC 559-6) TaxID=578456 RepID=UPI00032D4CF2|nr:uncharacterized protein TREMEDRAFT_65469 [Tremella mesenterica DSM 1558]EIW66599.1 hypothetical protein TREMEDRAFT_65469 [Tremella mesenterica DSM 1558]